MRVPDIVPCVCVDHKPDVADSCYYGMPQLKVSVGFDTSRQFYTPYCPNCGRGGCFEYKSAYLHSKDGTRCKQNCGTLKKTQIRFVRNNHINP